MFPPGLAMRMLFSACLLLGSFPLAPTVWAGEAPGLRQIRLAYQLKYNGKVRDWVYLSEWFCLQEGTKPWCRMTTVILNHCQEDPGSSTRAFEPEVRINETSEGPANDIDIEKWTKSELVLEVRSGIDKDQLTQYSFEFGDKGSSTYERVLHFSGVRVSKGTPQGEFLPLQGSFSLVPMACPARLPGVQK